eukprot:TRINITY_DN4978_c0_g1_i1.p1 TRINITY_DN4978_c0_g1~~TRINITY_DN4978_c0_g1_i1.p1  ORF type:complete len:474 (+),score=40.49 TRINITY_DN4978_c0_g1_i1:45-1466(+)
MTSSRALFEDVIERLKAHEISREDFLSYNSEELDELLREVLEYNVIERNKIKAEFARVVASRATPAEATATPTAESTKSGSAEPLSPKCCPEDEEPPQEFLCPITGDIMEDPVFTCDGHTYSRMAISRWFLQCKSCPPTSPNTGLPLENTSLTPNLHLRGQITAWRERTGRLPPPPPSLTEPPSMCTGPPSDDEDDSEQLARRLQAQEMGLALEDEDDDDSVSFSAEAMARIALIQGTLARSRATIDLMQRSVNRLRDELDSSRSSMNGTISSSTRAGSGRGGSGHRGRRTTETTPTTRRGGGSSGSSTGSSQVIRVCPRCTDHSCVDCRIAAHQDRYGWMNSGAVGAHSQSPPVSTTDTAHTQNSVLTRDQSGSSAATGGARPHYVSPLSSLRRSATQPTGAAPAVSLPSRGLARSDRVRQTPAVPRVQPSVLELSESLTILAAEHPRTGFVWPSAQRAVEQGQRLPARWQT